MFQFWNQFPQFSTVWSLLVRISLEIILLSNSCFFVAQFKFHVKKVEYTIVHVPDCILPYFFLNIPDSGFVLVMSEACKLGNV